LSSPAGESAVDGPCSQPLPGHRQDPSDVRPRSSSDLLTGEPFGPDTSTPPPRVSATATQPGGSSWSGSSSSSCW
jgi:hypothetical protein